MEIFIAIASAALGGVGYAILFNIRRDKMLYCAIGAALTWAVYLMVEQFTQSLFICNMLSAAFITLYSELMARIKKAPATCFLLPGVIPLVPGGGLYHTLFALINGNDDLFQMYFANTVETAFGISIGIMVMSIVGVKIIRNSILPISRRFVWK